MTSQKNIVMALALCAALAEADNCGTWSKGTGVNALTYATHQFKASDVLANTKCLSHKITAASCTNCCKTKDICANMVVACGADKVLDPALAGTATTSADKVTNCCVAEAKCDGMTCGTGWKDKAGKATIKCGAKACLPIQCCDVNVETCAGHIAVGNTCLEADEDSSVWMVDTTKDATALTTLQWGMFTATCCTNKKTCEGQAALSTGCNWATQYVAPSSKSTSVTAVADWKTNCCTDKPTANKCAGFTCSASAGWLADTTRDTLECWVTSDAGVPSSTCSNEICCKPDPAKCRGYTAPCDADHADASSEAGKAGQAVADATEYKAKCCLPKATCVEAEAYALQGTASGSPHQHEPVMALLLAVIGALALRL